MRLRSKGYLSNWPTAYTSDCYNQTCGSLGSWTNEVTNSMMYPWTGKESTFEDVVTPRFRTEVGKGKVFFNPMRQWQRLITFSGTGGTANETVKLNCSGTLYTKIRRWSDSHYFFSLTGGSSFGLRGDGTLNVPTASLNALDYDAAILEVATQARAKIKSGEAGGWESAAQYDKTLALLRNPLPNFKKLSSSFLRKARLSKKGGSGPSKFVSNALEVTSGEWLKYRYGVLPLINDFQAVLNELGRGTLVFNRHSARASLQLQKTQTYSINTTATGWACLHLVARGSTTTLRAMSLDEYKASSWTNLGLDLSQIPKTAWELVPFSFVVDWFVNVGDYLNALTPRLDVVNLGSCLVLSDVTVTTVTPQQWTAPSGHVIATPPTGTYQETITERFRRVPLTTAGLVIKNDFRLDRPVRLGDAFALIGQQLSRIRISS